jgi:hypothetical protein
VCHALQSPNIQQHLPDRTEVVGGVSGWVAGVDQREPPAIARLMGRVPSDLHESRHVWELQSPPSSVGNLPIEST